MTEAVADSAPQVAAGKATGAAAGAARPLAVVDIDGVVADVRHRLHWLERRPKEWDAFFAAAAQDEPLTQGLDRVAGLAIAHDIVWLTGRPERLRRITERWLAGHGLPAGPLHMRGDRDRRPARTFKLAALRGIAADRPVGVVLDDDPAVVRALSAGGWPVELADWVPRPDALDDAQERQGRS